MLEIIE